MVRRKDRGHSAAARKRARAIGLKCICHNIVTLVRRSVLIGNDVNRICGRCLLRFWLCRLCRDGPQEDFDARFMFNNLKGGLSCQLEIQRKRLAAFKYRAKAAEQESARAQIQIAQIIPIGDRIKRHRKPGWLRQQCDGIARYVGNLTLVRPAGHAATSDKPKGQAYIAVFLRRTNGVDVRVQQRSAARGFPFRLESFKGLGRRRSF